MQIFPGASVELSRKRLPEEHNVWAQERAATAAWSSPCLRAINANRAHVNCVAPVLRTDGAHCAAMALDDDLRWDARGLFQPIDILCVDTSKQAFLGKAR